MEQQDALLGRQFTDLLSVDNGSHDHPSEERTLGFHLSAHPLDTYRKALQRLGVEVIAVDRDPQAVGFPLADERALREAERTRIAREIHDELGSLLVALKMDVNWLAKRVAERDELAAKCRGMGRMIDTAVDNVGRIITDLRPSILDHQGLWAALEWQAQEFLDSAELLRDLQVHVAAGVRPPDGAPRSAALVEKLICVLAMHTGKWP